MDIIQTNSQTSQIDKFKLGNKWFWIGIIVATLNIIAGLVYGITLVIERDHSKEGLIIIAWAIIVNHKDAFKLKCLTNKP